eukprot:Partr_v1_DN27818_c0_g1_i3_m22471 putative CorA family metal ion transporter
MSDHELNESRYEPVGSGESPPSASSRDHLRPHPLGDDGPGSRFAAVVNEVSSASGHGGNTSRPLASILRKVVRKPQDGHSYVSTTSGPSAGGGGPQLEPSSSDFASPRISIRPQVQFGNVEMMEVVTPSGIGQESSTLPRSPTADMEYSSSPPTARPIPRRQTSSLSQSTSAAPGGDSPIDVTPVNSNDSPPFAPVDRQPVSAFEKSPSMTSLSSNTPLTRPFSSGEDSTAFRKSSKDAVRSSAHLRRQSSSPSSHNHPLGGDAPLKSADLDEMLIGFDPEHHMINFVKLREHLEHVLPPSRRHARTSNDTGAVPPFAGGDEYVSISLPTAEDAVAADERALSGERVTYYSMDNGIIESTTFEGLSKFKPLEDLLRSQYFWIDVEAPTADDMKCFANIFNIHPLTVEDIITQGTREKFEMYKAYYYICYCAFDQNPDSPTYMESFNVNLLIYSNFVISFHSYPLQTVRNVIRRLDLLKSYLKITTHWINYAILDDITDQYLPLIQSLEMEVDSIDDLVLVISQTEQADMLRRIAHARKRVMTLQRLLVAKSDVLRVLMKRLEGMANGGPTATTVSDLTPVYAAMLKDTCLYLGDVQDHVITMVQTLGHIDTTLNRCHSNYLAQINIELTTSSNTANDAVAKLTGLASILVPLNVVTGLWGMNVHVPGQNTGSADEGYAWFIAICVSMVAIVAGGLIAVQYMGIVGVRTRGK